MPIEALLSAIIIHLKISSIILATICLQLTVIARRSCRLHSNGTWPPSWLRLSPPASKSDEKIMRSLERHGGSHLKAKRLRFSTFRKLNLPLLVRVTLSPKDVRQVEEAERPERHRPLAKWPRQNVVDGKSKSSESR